MGRQICCLFYKSFFQCKSDNKISHFGLSAFPFDSGGARSFSMLFCINYPFRCLFCSSTGTVIECHFQVHYKDGASDYPREYDGACLQMRLSYSPAAHTFLFLVQWSDCRLAGALGFLRILIYKAYVDGKTTMSIHERKASIREFYGVIFPSLLQLQKGINEVDERKQQEIAAKYKMKDKMEKGKLSEIDMEREEECGICMEINSKIVLPDCSHSMCMKCYRSWRTRSQSCPFCRNSLTRVNSGDLWIYTGSNEIADLGSICRENMKRLYMYIESLPLITPDPVFVSHNPRYR